jgi:glucokinase
LSYVAVDIGATNIRVACGDESGLRKKLQEETDRLNEAEGIPIQIVRMIREIERDPVAIGVGSIGPIDHAEGTIKNTPNYPFKEIRVVEPLRTAFDAPVEIMNDCSAGVLGEHVFGAGRETDNLFYVTLSTGLGGGAIVDGHLLAGKDGNAVEIGHLTIDPHSRLICGCGCPGHWEAFSGGKNIPFYARTLLQGTRWRSSLLNDLCGGDSKEITAKMIFDAAHQGDEHALMVVEEIGRVNAVGFANIVNAYDPELITVGGSIALNNPELILDPIKRHITRHLINRAPEIMITPLGEDVVLYGAMAQVLGER